MNDEYVCEIGEPELRIERMGGEFSINMRKKERVVRCFDCAHCVDVDGEYVCQRMPFRFIVEPWGFCAWGMERGAE